MVAVTLVFSHQVSLTATSPSYFRGFTLIALKEGAEGDKDEDYAGNFQVWDKLKIKTLIDSTQKKKKKETI